MMNKWYDEPNPNCDWTYEEQMQERKHRRILRRRIASACKVAVVVSILCMLGFVGSAELGKISIGQLLTYEMVAMVVLLVSIKVGTMVE